MENIFPNKYRENTIKACIKEYLANYKKSLFKLMPDEKINVAQLLYDNFQTNDLSGFDLVGMDFSFCCLDYLNFESSDLSNSSFRNATLFKTNLRAARLKNTDFTESKILLCDMSKVSLNKNKFKQSIIHFANFSDSFLYKIDFSKADLLEPDFSRAKLRKINFNGLNLERVQFYRADLYKIIFQNADLNNACFINSRLQNINFQQANLDDVDMSYATLLSKNEKRFASIIKSVINPTYWRPNLFQLSLFFNASNSASASKDTATSTDELEKEVNTVDLTEAKNAKRINLYKTKGILPDEEWIEAQTCQFEPVLTKKTFTVEINNTFFQEAKERDKYQHFCLFQAKHQSPCTNTEEPLQKAVQTNKFQCK